jgi:hypothetical protein
MNFDLNIQNYNKQELESLFELPRNYGERDLHEKEEKLRKTIFSNSAINSSMKTKIISFLSEAKNTIIINNIQPGANNKSPQLSSTQSPNVSELKGIYKDIYNLDTNLKESDVTGAGGTFIIEPKLTPYGQSSPSEFYQGVINPLNKRIIKQSLNIDTRFRDNYFKSQSTNFHIDLPIRFTKVVSMQLASFETLKSSYVFSKILGNNFMAIKIGDEQQVITINDGNYTNTDLVIYLNSIMSNITSGDPNFKNIQFSQDLYAGSGSGRIIVSIKPPATPFDFSLNFQTDRFGNEDISTPLPLKFGWALGFRMGYYENSDTHQYLSEGLMDVVGPRYMYLVVDDHHNNVNNGFYSAFNSSILNNNILARISLQSPVFDVNIQSNLSMITNTRQYFGPVDIQKLDIQLIDEYGRIIDLNNMDYSFCLNLQVIYDL